MLPCILVNKNFHSEERTLESVYYAQCYIMV